MVSQEMRVFLAERKAVLLQPKTLKSCLDLACLAQNTQQLPLAENSATQEKAFADVLFQASKPAKEEANACQERHSAHQQEGNYWLLVTSPILWLVDSMRH